MCCKPQKLMSTYEWLDRYEWVSRIGAVGNERLL